jgi:hypothetical protein
VAADWVAAVTAVVSAGAALGGQAIAGRFQGRNQERLEARQRRDRAAARGGRGRVHTDVAASDARQL